MLDKNQFILNVSLHDDELKTAIKNQNIEHLETILIKNHLPKLLITDIDYNITIDINLLNTCLNTINRVLQEV